MSHDEASRLFDVARRTGSTPRHVLIRAARMTEQDNDDAAEGLRRLRDTGMRFCPLVDGCANLLLTPIASYAHNTLDNALELLWQDAHQEDT